MGATTRQPKYEGLRLEDDDLRSSTEVDESLMGGDDDDDDDKQQQWRDVELNRPATAGGRPMTRRRRRSGFVAALRSHRWLVDTVLLLVILGFVVRDHWWPRQQSEQRGEEEEEDPNIWQFGSDMTGVGPRLSHDVRSFSPDSSYAPNNTAEFFTEEVLQKWNDLMPKGNGFVWVNDTHRYHDLPTPVDFPGKTVFTTSVTHQLHCLFAIVQTYSGLSSGHEIPGDHHWHMIHCFDYMRQAIMCNGDMALEGRETTFPEDLRGGSDGWDAKHVCRKWEDVIDYLESVRPWDVQTAY
ncbi:hypothetical protein GGR56DRAFT_612359 [Xylariaceae sp. FL0804]|nr:hypothetical protein GGR56DRAFT_612359 [Xylariaceae sp. FL0804]